MEGEANQPSGGDLRFRLDWREEEGEQPAELSDFSFEWDDDDDPDTALAEAGEPEDLDPVEILTDPTDTAFYDPVDALEAVRRALDDNNDALRQLSSAVYELASSVRLLIDEVEGVGRAGGAGGDVAATAMVTMSAEVTTAVEQLSDELHGTRADMRALMDDVVAAAGGGTAAGMSQPRSLVELERIRSELQSLKRRLPVRARELDADEIAERVTEAVLAVLETGVPAPPPPPRRARPVQAAEPEPAPAPPTRAARTAKRQRPLRAD